MHTERPHHVLSTFELNYLRVSEWSLIVTDIREQYPLLSSEETLEETLAIARECEIDHSKHPKTGNPIVMTTDFLITISRNGQSIDLARSVKPVQELSSKRTLEKLEIERRYWQARGIDWGIVIERDIPEVLANNVHRLHSYWHLPEEMPSDQIQTIATLLTDLMEDHAQPLRHITTESDQRLGFHGKKAGASLSVAYYLIATRQWRIDMSVSIDTDKPLAFLGAALHIPHEKE